MALTHRNSQENTNVGTSLVINKPVGLAVGDLMIAAIGKDYPDLVATYPSGWTRLFTWGTTTGNNLTSWSGYKVADSADVAASNFTWTSDSEDWAGVISAFIPSNSNPIHVATSLNYLRENTATPTSGTIAAATAGNLLIGFCVSAQADTGGLTSTTTGYTIGGNPDTGQGNGDIGTILAYKLSADGTETSWQAGNAESGAESHPRIIEFSDIFQPKRTHTSDMVLRSTVSHTTDLYTLPGGTVAGITLPGAANPAGVMVDSFKSFVANWAVAADDGKKLVCRVWSNADPEAADYVYATYSPSWTFDTAIASYDIDEIYGYMAVQLINGEVYGGRYVLGASDTTHNEIIDGAYWAYVVYMNKWGRDQTTGDTNRDGLSLQMRKMLNAPASLPSVWGVRVNVMGYNDTDYSTKKYASSANILVNYESVDGVDKACHTWAVYDEDQVGVWGDKASDGQTPYSLGTHDMFNTPAQHLDPSNTTYDERIVGIVYGMVHQTRYVLWTREETSNTYLMGQTIEPLSTQEIWTTASGGTFTLKYPHDVYNTESAAIAHNANAATVQSAITGMSAITTATVVGAGTKSDPWVVTMGTVYNGVTPITYNSFYIGTDSLTGGSVYLTTADDPYLICEVKHQTTPRLMGTRNQLGFNLPTTPGEAEGIDPMLLLTDTDGKLSIMETVYGRHDVWQYVDRSISSGNVASHNGTTQAILWNRQYETKEAEISTTYGDYGSALNHLLVLYVDDSTKDIKAIHATRHYHTQGDGSNYPTNF